MTTTRPRGSAFRTADQGIFYNLLDFSPSATSDAGATNRTSIIAALTTIAAAGGGVLLVPHGVTHTFNPAVDFPVSANALTVWELQGAKFKYYGNQAIISELGDLGENFGLISPRIQSLEFVDDLDPVTYTFTQEVFNDAGTPVIAGSSWDLCTFIPGGAAPSEAIARAGANPGRHYFFAGVDTTHLEADTATIGSVTIDSGSISGVKKFNLNVQTPATGAPSIDLADSDELLHMNHAATIAAKTITLPAAPKDGQVVQIWSRSIITALTVAAGAGESIATGSTVTTIAALAHIAYVYRLSDTTWYRIA